MKRLAVALFSFGLAICRPAAGDVPKRLGVAAFGAGPVMIHAQGSEPQRLGLRADMSGSFFDVGLERYTAANMTRTRAEFGFHIPIRIGTRFAIEPQLGFMPFDYSSGDDSSLAFAISATGGVRMSIRLVAGLTLLLQPVRVEGRLIKLVLPPGEQAIPMWDRYFTMLYSSAAGLAYRW